MPSINPLLQKRWSPISFTDRMLTDEEIETLFEAARWAPSSFNEQPWRYVYARKNDGEKREKLESLLSEGNAWSKKAPLLVMSVAKLTFTKNGKPNRHAQHDNGSAMENMFLQAASMGLFGHGMAGWDTAMAMEIFQIGDGYEPLTMMAFGEHNPTPTDPAAKEREAKPRTRKEQSEFVFHGEWKEMN